MKKYNILILLLAVMSFISCKVSRDTQLSQITLPNSYRSITVPDAPAPGQDSIGIGALSWKEFFNEPDLRKLIDTAINNNNDLQVALKNIESARSLQQQSRLGNLPELSLQVTASSSRPSDNSLNGLSLSQYLKSKHIEDYSAGLNLSWEADIWGKIRNQKKEALAVYLQTAEARKVIQTSIVANIAQGYYHLLMLDKQLVIAQKNLILNDSTLRVVHLQYDAGQVTALAVQQTTAQQLVAAQLIPLLEQDITLQENALSLLMGKTPGAIVRSITLDTLTIPANLSAGIPSEMVSRRPDVKSTELALTIADARVGITSANRYPALNITAGGGLNAFQFSNWFSIPASLFGTVAGGITQPLFQRRQLKTQYEIAGIEREKAVIQFRQSVLNAVGEVSDALIKIDKLKSQQQIASNRVNTLEQAINNASLLFKNGMANYLEVITAQSNVLQSELDLSDIKRAQLYAVVDLYRSLGGGWQ